MLPLHTSGSTVFAGYEPRLAFNFLQLPSGAGTFMLQLETQGTMELRLHSEGLLALTLLM